MNGTGFMSFFEVGNFDLHSGHRSSWKIDCDALTEDDIKALAQMIRRVLPPFSQVEGVPRGGQRLAQALLTHLTWVGESRLLIVDDVLTTGTSMEQQRAGRDAMGVVIFARGPCPDWVTPLFTAHEVLQKE